MDVSVISGAPRRPGATPTETMPQNCKLTRFLQELHNGAEERRAVGLSFVAQSALNIIADIREERMTAQDVACLSDLVAEIQHEGYAGLSIYLKEDAPECEICNAVAKHLKLLD